MKVFLGIRCAAGRAAVLATGALLLVTACDRVIPPPPPGPSEVVETFFGGYQGNFREVEPALLSDSLAAAIDSAVTIERESAAAVLASDFPSDKPHLVEGEIFSGLYEGFTGCQIGEVTVAGDRASVEALFTNSHYQVGWIDRVELVDQDGWKIDDVRYLDKKAGALGLRDVLRDFKDVAAQDPLLNPQAP